MSVLRKATARSAAASLVLLITACSASQIQKAQNDQALVAGVLNAACSNNLIEAAIATAVPQITIACTAGVISADVITYIMSNPAAIAAVESVGTKYGIHL